MAGEMGQNLKVEFSSVWAGLRRCWAFLGRRRGAVPGSCCCARAFLQFPGWAHTQIHHCLCRKGLCCLSRGALMWPGGIPSQKEGSVLGTGRSSSRNISLSSDAALHLGEVDVKLQTDLPSSSPEWDGLVVVGLCQRRALAAEASSCCRVVLWVQGDGFTLTSEETNFPKKLPMERLWLRCVVTSSHPRSLSPVRMPKTRFNLTLTLHWIYEQHVCLLTITALRQSSCHTENSRCCQVILKIRFLIKQCVDIQSYCMWDSLFQSLEPGTHYSTSK